MDEKKKKRELKNNLFGGGGTRICEWGGIRKQTRCQNGERRGLEKARGDQVLDKKHDDERHRLDGNRI